LPEFGDPVVEHGVEMTRLAELVDEPNAERFLRIECSAGKEEIGCSPAADELGQAQDTACPGEDAAAHFREADAGGGIREAEVTGEGEFSPACQTGAADRGNRRNR